MDMYINKFELIGFLRIQRNLAKSLNQRQMKMAYQYVINKIEQGEFSEIAGEPPKYNGDDTK